MGAWSREGMRGGEGWWGGGSGGMLSVGNAYGTQLEVMPHTCSAVPLRGPASPGIQRGAVRCELGLTVGGLGWDVWEL